MFIIKGTIGAIKYTNAWPITYFMHFINTDFNYFYGAPSDLNRKLSTGELDVSLISSFSYGENFKDYCLLDQLSISSDGNVKSIMFFTKQDIKEIKQIKVALPSISATSVNLLKVILKELNIEATYEFEQSDLPTMMENADAALLIADYALYWANHNTEYHCYDLGEMFLEMTGLPMTFAVCAVRKDFLEKYPEEAKVAHELLLKSKQTGKMNYPEIINNCCRLAGETYEFWEDYFDTLNYDLKDSAILGLKKYFELCNKHGLLHEEVQFELISEFDKQTIKTTK